METSAKVNTLISLDIALAAPATQAQRRGYDGPPMGNMNRNDARQKPDRRNGDYGPEHGRTDFRERGSNKQRGPHGPGGKHDGWGGLVSLTTVSGTVGHLTANDESILDGFTLTTSTGTTTVKFPSHLGQQVQKAIKPGSAISVTGFEDSRHGNGPIFRMNSLTAGKTTVQDTPPTRPSTPQDPPAFVTATGKIADYRFDRGGRVNGFILEDKTVVNVPAHVAYQLTNLAKKGGTITVQGYPQTLREGQVQLEKVTMLRASVVTINGQQYLVR